MSSKTALFVLASITLAISGCSGCYTSTPPGGPEDGSDDPRAQEDWSWPDYDYDWRMDDLPWEIDFDLDILPPPPDMEIDEPPPDLTPPCPPQCLTIPVDGEIGSGCVTPAQCDFGAMCYTEDIEFYSGEMYVNNPGGQCMIIGAGTEGCDPDVPATCPTGSHCIYAGSSLGQDYYGCFDACEPVDTSGRMYEFNCGCAVGYACSLTAGVCMSGCSNHRFCCERWWDLNGDYTRGDGEVVVKEGCTNVCDNGGLYDEPPRDPGPCAVTFDCINNGDPTNTWGGPCEGDAWCPADGRCMDEFHSAMPCGYCMKEACNYVGRGCSEFGGACANLGYSTDPTYACVSTCRFGKTLDDPDYACGGLPGCEQACVPVDTDFWHTPPAGGDNGYCWPGNFPGGEVRIGGPCAGDDDCDSPFGLGTCMTWPSIDMTPFCSATCNVTASEDYALCGGDDGTGTAEGGCWSSICWEGCDNPDGALGSNGCTQSTAMACYDESLFGTYLTVDDGLETPDGICIPACTGSAWCADFFGMPMNCDTDTGVCG